MLKGQLIHPQILEALGRAGHGSKVLIADGNFPHSAAQGLNAEVVYMNLSPGVISTVQAVAAVVAAVSVQSTAVMQVDEADRKAMGGDPPVWEDFRRLVKGADNGRDPRWETLDRHTFYDAVLDDKTCLIIATGDQALYANLLITLGVVTPE